MHFISVSYPAFAKWFHGEINTHQLYFNLKSGNEYLYCSDLKRREIKKGLEALDKIRPRFLFFFINKDETPIQWQTRFLARSEAFIEYEEEFRIVIDYHKWKKL